MRRRILAIGCLVAAMAGEARAGIHGEALGRCAIEATSEADRATLVRWMFITLSSNPRLTDLATIASGVREQNLRAVGQLFNRVMLTACRGEAVAALRHEGTNGLQGGFEALGQLAAMEMMMTPAGMAALQELDRYVDRAGLEALGREAAARPAI